MATLEGFCSYAAITPDDDRTVARICYEAALQHAQDVGVDAAALAENEKCSLYIYALALHYYENRGMEEAGGAYAADEATRRIQSALRTELVYSPPNLRARGKLSDGT